MNVSKLAVNNRVTVYILVLIIVIVRIFSYSFYSERVSLRPLQFEHLCNNGILRCISTGQEKTLVTQEIGKEVKGNKRCGRK